MLARNDDSLKTAGVPRVTMKPDVIAAKVKRKRPAAGEVFTTSN
jgi:hypothetical protein